MELVRKIDLLSGYDSETLFDKIKMQAATEINAWPEHKFIGDQLSYHLTEVYESHRLKFPQINFDQEAETVKEKICALSSLERLSQKGSLFLF